VHSFQLRREIGAGFENHGQRKSEKPQRSERPKGSLKKEGRGDLGFSLVTKRNRSVHSGGEERGGVRVPIKMRRNFEKTDMEQTEQLYERTGTVPVREGRGEAHFQRASCGSRESRRNVGKHAWRLRLYCGRIE